MNNMQAAVPSVTNDPVYDHRGRRIPQPGDTWRSRDPRDGGLRITVLDVANGYVRIQRLRKTTVGMTRFHREYEFVAAGGA